MARQITLIDFDLYAAIKPWEFFNKGWTKESCAPNLFALINRFNNVKKYSHIPTNSQAYQMGSLRNRSRRER
jgi:hypothetical protein